MLFEEVRMLSQMILLNSTAKGTDMTKLEEMMEAHEDAVKMSKEWNCSYEEAFKKVWDCVWYDDEGDIRDRPSERKPATLLTPGV